MKLNFFLETRYFLVDGYWKEENEPFQNYVCCTNKEPITTEQYRDEEVFLFNQTIHSIREFALKDNCEDFVITKIQQYLPTPKEKLEKNIKGF